MESIRLSSSCVRESSEKILAVQRSTSSGVVFTIDRLAVRLWYGDKQIKALHFAETDHQLDVIGIEYISRIDGIAALLHIVKANDDSPIVNSVFRIWSSTLHVLCQVSFQEAKFSCLAFNARQDSFFVVEKGSRVRLLSLTTSQQQPDAPLFPKAARNGTDYISDGSMNENNAVARWKCDVREKPEDAFECPARFKAAGFYRTKAIIVLSDTSLHIYTAKSNGSMDGDVGETNFANTNSFAYLDLWSDQQVAVAHPTCMQVYDHDKLIIGFRDGRIRVLLCVDDLNSERRPTVLFDFHSNSDRLPYPVSCFSISPWNVNSEGIAFEIVSLSSDHIMSHWRLQLHRKEYTSKASSPTTNNRSTELPEKKKSQFLGYSHLLGEYSLGKHSSKKSRATFSTNRLVAFEQEVDVDPEDLVAVDDPGLRKKQIVATFDGLLLLFDVHEPHRAVLRMQQEITQSAMRVEPDACNIVTLHQREVRLFLTPLRVRASLHISADADADGGDTRCTGVAGTDDKLGRPTVVCFGGLGRNDIYVGFASGSMQCFVYADGYLAPVQVAADTATIHSTAIRKMITVIAPRALSINRLPDEEEPAQLVLLLAGDDQGILSLWQIGTVQPSEKTIRPKNALQWAAHAHLGAIIHTASSSASDFTNGTSNIIITGCNRGLVKCWVLQPSGKLALSAFFNSSTSLSAVVCLAIVTNLENSMSASMFGKSTNATKAIKGDLTTNKAASKSRSTTVSYLCLCGDSFGRVESRLLSNDHSKASQRPVRSMHVCKTSVSKIALVAANVNDERVQICGETSLILCSSIDGSFTFLELDETGYFRRAALYFSLPFFPVGILQFDNRLHVLSSHELVEIIKLDSSMSGFDNDRLQGYVDSTPLSRSGDHLTAFSESSGSRWDEETYPDNASTAASVESTVGHTQGQGPTKKSRESATRSEFGLITKRRKLVADVSAAVPGADMQSARKDGRLLELFKQFDTTSRKVLSRVNAVLVIGSWLGVSLEDESRNYSEVARVLSYFRNPIFDDDEVLYPELATVAAAAKAVMKQLGHGPMRKTMVYSNMNKSRRAISYGITGEKQESQHQLVEGNWKGRAATFSHIEHRVLGRNARDTEDIYEATEFPTLLTSVPPHLKVYVRTCRLPPFWSIKYTHYLDLRRTVRIVRTIMDTRGAMTAALDDGQISRQVVEYFHTNFGAANLEVASEKILNFLEALLQNSSFPVVNSLRKLVFEEEETEGELFPNKMALSYYLRARTYMYSRGFVVPGEFIPRDGMLGAGLGNSETTFGDTFAVPRQQLVLRLHGLECVQYILESSKFGPLATQRLSAMVRMLPSVTVVGNDHPYAPSSLHSSQFSFAAQRTGNLSDMIDCENFLDMVMEEIGRVVTVIDDLKQVCFEGINYDLGLLRLPKGADSPDAAFLHLITQMNMLAHRLMSHDPARTGRIGTDIFRDFVLRMSRPVHGSSEPHLKFVAECVSRFRCGHSGDEVSYLDLWATLLSHLVQKDDFSGGWANNTLGYIETNFPVWAHAALLGLQRGLEENRAAALVALLGYVPCETDEAAVVSNLGVPRVGSWAMHAAHKLPPELSGSGKFAVAAAKVVPESKPAPTPHGVSETKSDQPGEETLTRKATMREALHQPSVPKTQLQLQILADTHSDRTVQIKADLHPVVLAIPSSLSLGSADAEEEATAHTHLKRRQTYTKSYSRSVGSLDSKLVDIMLNEHHRRAADDDADVHQYAEPETAPSGLRGASKAIAVTEFPLRDTQEGMTCNEIEQLRIAQLVRQHDLLNKMDLEQEMLRRRREKRMIDAKLMTKKDKRQPKKRVPMPVYTEPEHVHVPKKISFPKAEHRPAAIVVAPRPVPPAPTAVKPTSAAVAKKPEPPTVTISKEVVPEKLVVDAPSIPTVVMTSAASAETSSALVDPLEEADEESTQTAPELQSSEPLEELADTNEDDAEDQAADEDEGADELHGDTISDNDAANEEEENENESVEAISVGTAATGKRDMLSAANMRVEAPLVSPSLATALVTPGVEREEERNREQFELRLMRTNDFAAPNRSKHVPARPSKSVVEIYYSSSEEEEESDEEKLSEAEKRIRFLKKKLEDAKSGYHPRRAAEEMAGVAFFPMLFSDDLIYNPCSATSGPLVVGNGTGDYVTNTDGESNQAGSPRSLSDPVISAADFSDIRRVVQERKAMMNKERLQQLYKTSSVTPDEWVSVVRKQGVDWEKYMDKEKDSRLQQALTGTGKKRSRPRAGLSPRPITSVAQLRSSGPLPGGHVAAALASIALNAVEGDEPRASKEDLDAVANAEEDEFFMRRIENHERRLAQSASAPAGLDDPAAAAAAAAEIKPTALPFGKVVTGICEIDAANYFYIQVTSPASVVTIELQCTYGFADVYSASDGMPTTYQFTQRAACTLENGKIGRITTSADHGSDHICILVHSRSTGAAFSLWAYETGKMTIEVPEIKRAMLFAKAFNLLIENDEEDLNLHLPRLLADAHETVELEEEKAEAAAAVFRRQIDVVRPSKFAGSESNKLIDENSRLDVVIDASHLPDETATSPRPPSLLEFDDEDSEGEEDVVERYIYRKSITLLRGDPTINPNVDPQLMLPCLIPKRELPVRITTEPITTINFPRIKGNATSTAATYLQKMKKLGSVPQKKLTYNLTKYNKGEGF